MLVACSAEDTSRPGVDVDRALGHVRALSETIGRRPVDSPAARQAAVYIGEQLRAIGVTAEERAVGDVEILPAVVGPFTFIRPYRAHTDDVNVVARFGPPATPARRALLFMAHYDSVLAAPGAVDNAVAVGVLVELARVLAREPPPAPVWLAFTAGEEQGLLGARALAAGLGDQVGFAVSLDLLGTDGQLIVNGASELVRDGELRWLADAADAAGVDLAAPWPHRVVSRWWPQIERSDHGPFTMRGVRAVHFFHRGADGERIYLAYHTGRDTLAEVSRAAVAETGRLARALAMRPPPAPDADADLGVWLPLPGNLVVPRWSWLALCGLALAAALAGVFAQRRRSLSPGPGLFAAVAVWIAATAAALGVEHVASGDHPAPWVHAPLYAAIATALVLFGVATFGAALVARWRVWGGRDRFATAAVLWNLMAGVALVSIGAAEIAPLWLVPAALLAWVPRLRAPAIALAALALAPSVVLLDPDLLRESVFHGFLPTHVPLAVILAVHLVTPALVVAHFAARVRLWGPGVTLLVPAAGAIAAVVGAVLLYVDEPPCTARSFRSRRIACEVLGQPGASD